MFEQLNALRGKVKTLGLAITFAADNKISVIVSPVVTEEAAKSTPSLSIPFSLVGTPAEMDAGFSEQFAAYTVAFGSLESQTKIQLAAMAEKKVADDAAKAKSVVGKPKGKTSLVSSDALSNALVGGDDDEDPEGSDSTPAQAADTTPVKGAEAELISVDQLF